MQDEAKNRSPSIPSKHVWKKDAPEASFNSDNQTSEMNIYQLPTPGK